MGGITKHHIWRETPSPLQCKVASQEMDSKPADQDLDLHTNVIEVLYKVSPSVMKESQQSASTIFQIVQYVRAGKKPELSQI